MVPRGSLGGTLRQAATLLLQPCRLEATALMPADLGCKLLEAIATAGSQCHRKAVIAYASTQDAASASWLRHWWCQQLCCCFVACQGCWQGLLLSAMLRSAAVLVFDCSAVNLCRCWLQLPCIVMMTSSCPGVSHAVRNLSTSLVGGQLLLADRPSAVQTGWGSS